VVAHSLANRGFKTSVQAQMKSPGKGAQGNHWVRKPHTSHHGRPQGGAVKGSEAVKSEGLPLRGMNSQVEHLRPPMLHYDERQQASVAQAFAKASAQQTVDGSEEKYPVSLAHSCRDEQWEVVASKVLRKWLRGSSLTRKEQSKVNELTICPPPGNPSQVTIISTLPSNRYEVLRNHERPKHPKHGETNFKKVVEQVAANLPPNKVEPEPAVGCQLPIQYAVSPSAVVIGADAPEAPKFTCDDPLQLRLREVKLKLRKVRAEWTSKVPFGPEERPSAPFLTANSKWQSGWCSEYRERRIVDTTFKIYKFPYLHFIGLWNNCKLKSDLFVGHLGFHFHEEYVEVEIPEGLVDELKKFWCWKTQNMDNFILSASKCNNLTSEFAIKPDQLHVANLYAPAIAFTECSDEHQNVARVTFGHYVNAFGDHLGKNLSALKTVRGKILMSCVVLFLIWARFQYRRWSKMFDLFRQLGRFIIRPRLVGIELNPGPRCRQLVNCGALPAPKSRKDGAKLQLIDGDLRPPLDRKLPLQCNGKHIECAFDTGPYRPTAFASNQWNEKQALIARVLCDTIEPSTNLLNCIDWCKHNHRLLFPRMHHVLSVSFEEYLKRSNASPSVKRVLQATMEKLRSEGIDEETTLSRTQLYKYTYRTSFVKVENDLYQSPLGRKEKAPRLIQGAQPEFICLVGPWIMALQDLLKRRWNQKSNLCFTSGMTAEKAAAFIVDGTGDWLEDDLGKFDSSIRRPWCEYEVWLCEQFGAPRAVIDLMHTNIGTHGATHHGWRYKCDGTRKSGDPYTSLMNSVINGVSHLYLYCSWTERTVLQAQGSIRMLLQGDDNLLRHSEQWKFPWQQGMATLGFESEAIYRGNLELAEFCSSRIYKTKQGYCFGPKPGRVLAKYGYLINPPKGIEIERVMRGVALGLQRSCNFIPPLSKFVERTLILTQGHKAWVPKKKFVPFDEDPLKVGELHEACADTMLNLHLNYDWDYGKQSLFETRLHSLLFGQSMHGVCELFLDKDTGGPQLIFGGFVKQNLPEQLN